MRGLIYQLSLLFFLALVTALFGIFLYREIYPEYKIYQHAYLDLEEFRSTLLHEPIPPFETGVQQIVLMRADGGPETIDRCTSCHVALEVSYFSPTKISRDINGEILRDSDGIPLKVANDQYIFRQLDETIRELTDMQTNEGLLAKGEAWRVDERRQRAERLAQLKTGSVHGRTVDLSKVLAMHPLLGRETRPFEYHSAEEIGCTACHNGNGRALTTEKAHGPVFDGQYEPAQEGEQPQFLDSDPYNDPPFSRVFNHKPGHELLFQTTPLYVGGLIEANCVQCHRSSTSQLESAASASRFLQQEAQRQVERLQQSYLQMQQGLIGLIATKQSISANGIQATLEKLKQQTQDFTLSQDEREQFAARISYINAAKSGAGTEDAKDYVLQRLNADITDLVGAQSLVDGIDKVLGAKGSEVPKVLEAFLGEHQSEPGATGRLFIQLRALEQRKLALEATKLGQAPDSSLEEPQLHSILTDIDLMTGTYQRGKLAYLSQACYACHRIAGFSRGGVGPELTRAGLNYPWFLKQSLVWPQADLKSSTMPNMRLDHKELEGLMTFLLAQKGKTRTVSDVDYQIDIKQWESGKKLPWEQPLSPDQIHNLDYSMTIFATEGCAACHRLRGYVSDVGFAVEKSAEPSTAVLQVEREWFRRVIPELIGGSDISGPSLVKQIEEYAAEIDQRIISDARQGSLLEKIEAAQPGVLQSFYSNFEFALRAKNHTLTEAAEAQQDASEKANVLTALSQWQERVNRVMMMYIQEYGLGRLIGPRPNWSGVYRSDAWLMEHFRYPSGLVARSLMPVFPFDETKFTALMYMLDILGRRNTEAVQALWQVNGFNPAEAYNIHCSQCHGTSERREEAPVLPWIYPIPKNLRNSTFLQNLTRPRVIESLIHGVKGTPMPPWGETPSDKPFTNDVPVLKPDQIIQLVDWLFHNLPSNSGEDRNGPDIMKWKYEPEDVLQDLKREGDILHQMKTSAPPASPLSGLLPSGAGYIAALDKPTVAMENSANLTDTSDLFDSIENPVQEGVDQTGYYIKKKFYTTENLEAGRRLFVENCSICHGAEGGGDGARAGEMSDAKPRMFTNFNWLRTRDDLRLLRSIKYGIPGTSMTPWGDLTSTLQRLQMVMYIRQLSSAVAWKDQLEESLYSAFDATSQEVRLARIAHYPAIETSKAAYQQALQERKRLHTQALEDATQTSAAVSAYESEITLLARFKKQEEIDRLFQELMDKLHEEQLLYERQGKALLNARVDAEVFEAYLRLVELNRGRFHTEKGQLTMRTPEVNSKAEALLVQIAGILERKASHLQKQTETVKGQLTSPAQREELKDLSAELKGLQKLRNDLTTVVADSERLQEQQRQIYLKLQDQLRKNRIQ